MWADGPTREEIRHAAEQVFVRGEFRRNRTIVERILAWIRDHLPHSSGPTPAAGGSSGLAQLVLYLLGFAVVVLLVWIVVRVVRTRVRRSVVEDEVDPEPHIDEERTTAEWRSDAEVAESEGRWKDAIRFRYRELVAGLVEVGAVEPVAGRTTGELRADVARSSPAVAEAFSDASLLFEMPWYADRPTGPAENARLRELAGVVRGGARSLDDTAVDLPDAVVVPA